MTQPRQSHARRFFMPAVIALVALVVVYFTTQQNMKSSLEVQRRIEKICGDALAGREIADQLNTPNALVAQKTAEAIKDVWSSSPAGSREVVVAPGDIAEIGDGLATHTALLRVNHRDALGLRVRYAEPGDPIEVLGFWMP